MFCTQERSRLQNRERALEILRAKLLERELAAAAERESSDRRAQVGSGDRSEKIRTYNYKDNRTTITGSAEILHSILCWRASSRI